MTTDLSGPIRWGICSTGKISSDFASALLSVGNSSAKIVALVAKDIERAQTFADKFELKETEVFDSYDEFAKCDDIQVVYVGSLNSDHHRLTKLFLTNNKHVLVEKPIVMNPEQLKDLMALAKEKNLFLMEGMWNRFFPVYKEIIPKAIKDGDIGDVKHLSAHFTVPGIMHFERINRLDFGGGVIYDLGIYTLMLALYVFKEYPTKILATGELTESGVDVRVAVTLEFSDGKMAQLIMGGTGGGPNSATIMGTKGYIIVPHFCWCPEDVTIVTPRSLEHALKKSFHLPVPQNQSSQPIVYKNSEGLQYEATAVMECIRKGLLECPDVPLQHSLWAAEITQEIFKQIGRKTE